MAQGLGTGGGGVAGWNKPDNSSADRRTGHLSAEPGRCLVHSGAFTRAHGKAVYSLPTRPAPSIHGPPIVDTVGTL